ncbi:MAG: transcription elongation factor Spt5 [Candidatus Methanoliparum thermophilum]|uniref:Transcription elongation factor Spt5 n=1 Tax=Methanoliparum thermophilum TaxID=2491083 RepID=A0A520KTL0_METT2|nr:transcription elongation factor Spt5 [Candidatus Methanoliparum sp. LAM-1]RZN65407.1 MAG: transcription elongation factor Spt5 [Candidatus Methanoliparum thermophilum]BDC35504.1 transcription elongation factor Spt5 [Candidatus Methanoliparum sp. LAM-1]
MSNVDLNIYIVKTVAGEERNVADMIMTKINTMDKTSIASILVPYGLKGYFMIEGGVLEEIEEIVKGIPHAKGIIKGSVPLSEIEPFLMPQPSAAKVKIGDIVEIINGPFKGEKAKVKKVDINKEEITVEFFESMVIIPVTVKGSSIRVIDSDTEDKK